MTRDNFLNNVTHWPELLEFCSDTGCETCENIVDSDQLDEYIEADLRSTDDYSWRDIRDLLSGIPTGYEYYDIQYGCFQCDGMGEDDFNRYKSDVLDWCDAEDIWDDEPDKEDADSEEKAFPVGELTALYGSVFARA